MDMILFRVSVQRFLVIPMRSKWDDESFPLECPNPLSFRNSRSTPFSISFCKTIDLFPQGVNCGCLHYAWRLEGRLYIKTSQLSMTPFILSSNILSFHSPSSTVFSSSVKTFPGQVVFLLLSFGSLCFHLLTQFYNLYLPQICKFFVHCWLCPDSAIVLYIYFYFFIYRYILYIFFFIKFQERREEVPVFGVISLFIYIGVISLNTVSIKIFGIWFWSNETNYSYEKI